MRATIAAGFAAALLAAGCGGDDNGKDTATTKTESKADYIAKADAVCKDANAKITELNRKAARQVEDSGEIKKPEDALKVLAPVLEEGLDLQKETQAKFKAIAPPDSEKERIGKLNAAYDQQIALVEKVTGAAKDGDLEEFNKLLAQQATKRADTSAQAQTFGFKECGKQTS